ncbi:MAG TPA: hypothetical protein VJR25_09000, partial [Microbacterium sp.]|nr:hypothetical protein [Microbacterium sp.]
MSTPDQPESPQLTRKQLRELRNTGVTPVITDPGTPDGGSAPDAASDAPSTPIAPAPTDDEKTPPPAVPSADAPTAIIAPLPRAAEPVIVPPAPIADASVDLGTAPLTRRQARQQERIRTASVPVITPEVAAVLTQAAPVVRPVPVIAGVAAAVAADAASGPAASASAPTWAGPTAPAPALPVEDPAHP